MTVPPRIPIEFHRTIRAGGLIDLIEWVWSGLWWAFAWGGAVTSISLITVLFMCSIVSRGRR